MSARGVLAVVGVVGGWAVAAPADDADIKKAAKAEVRAFHKALADGDYKAFVRRMHPKQVELLGGEAKAVEKVAAGIAAVKADGGDTAGAEVRVADPSDPVRAGGAIYLVLPTTSVMTVRGRRVRSHPDLLGVSSDGGKTWVFLDATLPRAALKLLLPDLPDAVILPDKRAPEFAPDKD